MGKRVRRSRRIKMSRQSRRRLHNKSRRTRSKSKRRVRRTQRGGYKQFMSNEPKSYFYSRGGVLSPEELGLANPAPHQIYNKCA